MSGSSSSRIASTSSSISFVTRAYVSISWTTRCLCASKRSSSRWICSWRCARSLVKRIRSSFSSMRSLSTSAASRSDGTAAPIATACTASSVASAVRCASSSCSALHCRCSSRMRCNCSKRTFKRRTSRSFSERSSWIARCSSSTVWRAVSSNCTASARETAKPRMDWQSRSKSCATSASVMPCRSLGTRRSASATPPSPAGSPPSASTDSFTCLTRRPMASIQLDSFIPSSQMSWSTFSMSAWRSWRTCRSCPRSHLSRSISFFE
mmetsp:Transcript_60727/g.180893  ORF Transcript_60727/g.180893 Transcript_60727/m.180893 type:complete len:266 (-) Transcript_60727:1094-1891(-)